MMRFRRRMIGGSVLLAGLAMGRAARAAAPVKHRLALHIDENVPSTMNEVLNNLVNAAELYAARHEAVAIELVANGDGYAMLRDVSPVRDFVADVRKRFPFVVFSACQNSRRAVARREGKTVEQVAELPGVTDVPAGIVRLMELQEQGWSYYKV